MSKKFYLLICVVFVLALANGAVAQDVRSWWSDLAATNDWNEPNNWWTMEGANPNWVKSAANSVPDINSEAFVGKGGGWQDYPADLNDLIVAGHVIVDPTIDGTVTAVVQSMRVGGGDDLQGNGFGDPCADHYLTVTGGTLTVGTEQDWEGDYYEWTDWYGWGMFNGQWASGHLAIGACLSDDVNGTGTMTMSGGVVNIGGHIEVGGWGSVGLLDMTGGEINIFQGVYCPATWAGDTGRINLHGGTINARYIRMTDGPYGGNTGIIDVTGGVMTFERDETDDLIYYEDYVNVGAYGNDISITSYGARHGEIITDSNYGAALGKRAALVIDYDVSNEGKTTLAAETPTDPCQAWAPSPADGAGNVKGPQASLQRPILSWSDGNDANKHDVYFGTSLAEVNNADTTSTSTYIGQQELGDVNWPVDRNLEILTQYYWRIDEVNTVTVKGQVWDFTLANVGKSSYPSPSNEADEVPSDVTINWTPGIFTVTHDVYLGTSFDDVNEATSTVDPNNVFMGNQGPNSFDVCDYDPNALVFSTTYYWRIDDVNGGTTYPGDVWSFTTASHLIVEDFDSYVNQAELWNVWDDYWVNGTGSGVSPEKDPNFTRDGNSIRFAYDGSYSDKGQFLGSVIDANIVDLAIGSDWTVSDARALVLYFYGQPGNAATNLDAMWVELEDTSSNSGYVIYDKDPNDVKLEQWNEWNIDLAIFDACGVSLANVDRVHIGFGSNAKVGVNKAGGTGIVWFDDMQVWPQRCVPAVSLGYGDFSGDCVIDAYDVEQIALDWLESDSEGIAAAPSYDPLVWLKFDETSGQVADNSGTSGASFDGQIGALPVADGCDPAWANDACRANHLTFDGVDDHVVIPPLNLNTNTATLTAWVQRNGDQVPWSGIVFCRGPNTLNDQWPSTVSGIGFGGESKTATVHDLRYHWDDWWWSFETGLTVPDGEWTFVGLVVSPDRATVYKSNGTTLESKSNVTYHGPDAWDANAFVGCDPQKLSPAPGTFHRMVYGQIDDVRIYDSSLTVNEIMGLAGVPGVIYFPLDEPTNLVVRVPDPAVDPNYYPGNPDIVNFQDYDVMADNWLKEYLFP
ncbi:MAG: LamG domain-containing protein [Planctomycetota bacterium]|jgi:hypothetical protein